MSSSLARQRCYEIEHFNSPGCRLSACHDSICAGDPGYRYMFIKHCLDIFSFCLQTFVQEGYGFRMVALL